MKLLKNIHFLFITALLAVSFIPQPAQALPSYIQKLFNQNILYYNRGCDDQAPAAASALGTVYLIGDSVAAGAKAEIEGTLQANKASEITINAVASRSLTEGSGELNGISVLKADQDVWDDAANIVIELGTNGGVTQDTIKTTIDTIKQVNTNAKIFWVNVGIENSKRPAPLDFEPWNNLINQQASSGYVVIDWAAQVKQHPDYIADDGIGAHTTGAGIQAYADTIANAMTATGAVPSSETADDLGCPCQTASLLPGRDNPEKVWNFFISKGLGPVPVAGIMGNMQAESGFDPTKIQGGGNTNDPASVGGKGWGLIQWTPGKKAQDSAQSIGLNGAIHELSTQLELVWGHMNNAPPITKGSFDIPFYKSITDVAEATAYWEDQIEGAGIKRMEARIGFATHWLTQFGGNTGGGAATGATGGCAAQGTCAPGTNNLGQADGYKDGQLTKITICAVTNLPSTASESTPGDPYFIQGADGLAIVNADISAKVYELAQAAAAAGVVPRAGSSFRSMAHQTELYNCWKAGNPNCNEAAEPGFSNHQMGLAIDFSPIQKCPSTQNGKCADTGSPMWNWLNSNASNYGFTQLSSEAWHWSTDGG